MTTSERIKIIKEISNVLKKEEWGLLDLTLKQFNFQTSDIFQGEKIDYIIQHIQKESDEKLVDLASHLEININSVESDLNPIFWKAGYFKLFISHLATDKGNAQTFKNEFDKYAISGFVAHTDIEPTKDWQNEIELALKTCDCLIALMIPGFHESKWTDQEIGVAFGRDLLIIPIRMGQDPYGFIGKFQAITKTNTHEIINEIFTSLLKNKKTSKKIAYSLMFKFENSMNYVEAKDNMNLIEKIEYWDTKLIERLKKSKDNNSQISDSYGVPNRIQNLLQKIDK